MKRSEIKNKYGGRCGYCGGHLGNSFNTDHIVPIYRNCSDEELKRRGIIRGTNDFDNLIPSCFSCNSYKKTMPVEVFRQELSKLTERLNRDSSIYRIAKRYGMIVEHKPSILFHFEILEIEKGVLKLTQ